MLALIFAFVVSLMVWGIAEWSGNNLRNTASFEVDRSTLYGAGGATQTAIATVGTTPPTTLTNALTASQSYSTLSVTALPTPLVVGDMMTIGTPATNTTPSTLQSITVSSPANSGDTTVNVTLFASTYSQPAGATVNLGVCPGGGPITIGGANVTVYCNVVRFPQLQPPDPSITREVTFSACLTSVSQATCMQPNSSYVRAVIDYSDINTSGNLQCTSPSNNASCGTGLTYRSWVVQTGQM
jgi:hypothetical protein